MAAENISSPVTGGTRRVKVAGANVKAVASPFARQTYVNLPSNAKGRSGTVGAAVPAILADNARGTHLTGN